MIAKKKVPAAFAENIPVHMRAMSLRQKVTLCAVVFAVANLQESALGPGGTRSTWKMPKAFGK
ncbi:hypothetical protein [Tsuneonella suprasediminis]|uniref:hypothetical protein n=1 Tax=Tsuneonella suprasediminis TaxID=2306996 RepID=UPI001058939A|nr:hypothetical protein [Tsuneonella suprasediminis]